jgi:tetratricopeptide (TPR) repeat protein
MKYKYIVLVLSIFTCLSVSSKSKTDSLLYVLNATIKDSSKYDADKIRAIERLKKESGTIKNNDWMLQFKINEQLYQEYRVFNYDSAFVYTKKMQVIGEKLNNLSLIASANINFGFILLSAGMFKEAIEILTSINIHAIPDSLKADYYSLLARYYYDLSDYNNSSYYSIHYREKASRYLDTSLSLYPRKSFEYSYFIGLKNLKNGNINSAFMAFRNITDKMTGLSYHQYALATSTLSGLYMQEKQNDEAINFLIEAAIADIKSSTKETTALLYLAGLLFDKGDTKNASVYIEKANNDAQYYGARQRKIQIGTILPIIESQVITTIEDQKRNLLRYSVLITVFNCYPFGYHYPETIKQIENCQGRDNPGSFKGTGNQSTVK